MRILIITLAGGALIATGAVTPAAAQRFGRQDLLEKADRNKDGYVTRAEFDAARAASFADMDRNGDGFISREDFPRLSMAPERMQTRLNDMIRMSDANGDGRVSRAEMVNGPAPIFTRADVNRDNRLDQTEIADTKAQLAQMRPR